MKSHLVLSLSLLAAPLAFAGAYVPAPTPPPVTPVLPAPKAPSEKVFHFDLAGGATWLEDMRDFTFNPGWSITGAFGVEVGSGLSVELESGYFAADVEEKFQHEAHGLHGKLTGDVVIVPVLANIKYTAPVTQLFNYYIGAGAGAFHSDSSVNVGPLGDPATNDEWDFGFQGFAGLSIPLSEVLSIELGYRFLAGGFNSDELRSHSVEAGIHFTF